MAKRQNDSTRIRRIPLSFHPIQKTTRFAVTWVHQDGTGQRPTTTKTETPRSPSIRLLETLPKAPRNCFCFSHSATQNSFWGRIMVAKKNALRSVSLLKR